jgi:hypothetical protein
MTELALPLMALSIVLLIVGTTYLTFRAHGREKAAEEAEQTKRRGFRTVGRSRSKAGS